jgi:hypothetical protein
MFQAFTRTLPRRYQAAVVVLGLGAVAGWGLLSETRGLTAEPERQSSTAAAELPAGQRPTLPERDRAQSPATEAPSPSMSSGFGQKEIARLASEKVLVQPKPVMARAVPQPVSSTGRQPPTGAPQPGLIARKPPTPPQAPARRVSTAQAKAAPGESKR